MLEYFASPPKVITSHSPVIPSNFSHLTGYSNPFSLGKWRSQRVDHCSTFPCFTYVCLCFFTMTHILPMFYLCLTSNCRPRTSIGGSLCGVPESLPAASAGDGFPHREGRFDTDGTDETWVSWLRIFPVSFPSSTLWWTNILPWKITMFNGKIHYKWYIWPIEIVDFPINSMVDLSMAKCKRSPEGTAWWFGTWLFHGISWCF